MVYTLRFFSSSKCSLFHNSNVFGSCIIHILYTGYAKIKKIIPAPKGYLFDMGRTAPLTSKRCTLYIYSANIGTKYFKHGVYTLRFFLFKMQLVS